MPWWLCMIDRGATTIWEDGDGLLPDGTAKHSLNHYSKGRVISFLHRYTAGLQLVEPGYRRVRIAPRPGHGITRATAHHDAPHGRIEVAWHLDGPDGELTVSIPDGTIAEIELPDGAQSVVGEAATSSRGLLREHRNGARRTPAQHPDRDRSGSSPAGRPSWT